MKKILSLMIAIMAMCVQSVSAQEVTRVMLHHNGKATLYAYTNVQGAINAAVDGDTIYIPSGNYNSQSLSITKNITIMGQGTGSRLGDITINLPGGTEMTSTILYGVNVGYVTVKSSITNLHIDKCTLGSLDLQPNSSTSTKTYTMKNMLIERSNITSRFIATVNYDKFEDAVMRNCNIRYFSNRSQNISFKNCTLGAAYGQYNSNNTSNAIIDYIYGDYVNCIIKRFCDRYYSSSTTYGGYIIDKSASFVNCLYGEGITGGTTLDCVYSTSAVNYTDEELRFNGYLGTDGTIVGCNGGARPYNLTPAVPSLEDIKLDVNYTTRKLNVTVKVKAN